MDRGFLEQAVYSRVYLEVNSPLNYDGFNAAEKVYFNPIGLPLTDLAPPLTLRIVYVYVQRVSRSLNGWVAVSR